MLAKKAECICPLYDHVFQKAVNSARLPLSCAITILPPVASKPVYLGNVPNWCLLVPLSFVTPVPNRLNHVDWCQIQNTNVFTKSTEADVMKH